MIRTVLTVSGMMCGMCEAHINDAVRAAFPVRKVASSRRRGETVILSDLPLDREKLGDVIRRAGYTLTQVSESRAAQGGLLSRLLPRRR